MSIKIYNDDDELYELISEEIESNNTKKGLWTKAFNESEGDEQKAKALYIKHRFDQIKDGQPQTDEENSSNINEEFETSENTFTQKLIRLCYYCSKPLANLRIIFKGELRQFCNDECYQSCLRKNDLSEKNLKEEQEHWEKRNKKIKEESLENVETINWEHKSLDDSTFDKVCRLSIDGLSNTEITNDSGQPPKNISGLKFYFYLKIIIGIDICLIILGFVGDLKVDFLILNLGTWLVLFVTFYIYYFWKIEKYNLYIKLLISVVAFSSAVIVNVVYDIVVLKPQKEIWYKEAVDEVLRKIEK